LKKAGAYQFNNSSWGYLQKQVETVRLLHIYQKKPQYTHQL